MPRRVLFYIINLKPQPSITLHAVKHILIKDYYFPKIKKTIYKYFSNIKCA